MPTARLLLVSGIFILMLPAPLGAQPLAPNVAAADGVARALGYTVTIEGQRLFGAGVLLAPARGLVATAAHVVDGMARPRVSFADGADFDARVLEIDRTLDLALLRIRPQPNRPAPVLAPAGRLRPGDEVYAIGCPHQLPFTVSRGIVSFVDRPLDGVRWLQTDLPINAGNSGGPVVDPRGEWVGLMSFILRDSQGLSFALPAHSVLERFAAQLRPTTASRP